MNAGEITISLLLENKIFAEQIKTSLNLLKIFKTNAMDILKGIPVTFETNEIDKQLEKEEQALKRLKSEISKTDNETKQYNQSQKDVEVSTTKLSGVLANAGLRYEGFRAVIQTLQSTFGSLIQDYQAAEIGLSKLSNGLKNVGEGATALNKLSQQASNLQKITPFADEDINNAQAMLTTFQKNSDEIEILTPRILDLAAAYQTSGESGMDLQQVAVLLGKVNEETIGGLRRVGVAFTKEQEEKLKSLKGTEQAIFLSEILDQNFKGMAETIGNTVAGKVAIFKNEVGELREAFGKLLSGGLLDIITIFKPFVKSLADASPAVQKLALGVIGLGAAFVVLNTSLGGLPYILGTIITLLYSMGSVYDITSEQVKKNADEVRKSTDVSKEMMGVLDSLKLSANNMAEAYDAISNAIGSMTKNQLLSARDFISSEKAKALALAETMTVMELQNLANMDFVPPDKGESIKNRNKLIVAPDLDKFDELLKGIESRLKFVKGSDSSYTSGVQSSKSKSDKDAKEYTTYLQELIKQLDEIQKRIDSQKEGENIVEGLYGKKEDIENKIKQIKELNELGTAGYITKRARKELADIKLPEKKFGTVIKDKLSENENKTGTANTTPEDKLAKGIDQGISLAQQLSNVLGIGADTFAGKLLSGLQEGLSLANSFASFLSAVFNIGSGGIFGLLGLASGGLVPGSGTGDTVPAMLTPGEFVVKQSRVSQLGTGFLTWLNGGGLFNSMAGHYASGGMVTASGSGGVQVVVLDSRIKGSDIVLSQARTNKIDKRRTIL